MEFDQKGDISSASGRKKSGPSYSVNLILTGSESDALYVKFELCNSFMH